jgi:tetratricopeptide (TPR) repeat protein
VPSIYEISKEDILYHLTLYKEWWQQEEPRGELPAEISKYHEKGPNGIKAIFGFAFHLLLIMTTWLSLTLRALRMARWAAKKRIQRDDLWMSPASLGLHLAFTDLGLVLLQEGRIEEAIDCLRNSCRIYPDPYTLSYGMSKRLVRKLMSYPQAKSSVEEYLEMRNAFLCVSRKSMI